MQSGKLIAGSLCKDFDSAIRVVAYPTQDPENMRLALYKPAEADALYTSPDQKTAGFNCFFSRGHARENAEARGQNNFLLLTLLRSRQIHALGGIYFDLFAFIDEWRHLHYQSGFCLRGFGHTRCSRAF
jgi:hypothetical protein